MSVSSSEPSAEPAIVGFTAWLANHHWPHTQRQRYGALVESFLCWQRERGREVSDWTEDAYCAGITALGASPAQLAEVHMAMDLFHDYLESHVEID